MITFLSFCWFCCCFVYKQVHLKPVIKGTGSPLTLRLYGMSEMSKVLNYLGASFCEKVPICSPSLYPFSKELGI